MLLLPSTLATCFGHTDHPSRIKYVILRIQNQTFAFRICEISQVVIFTYVTRST